MGFISFGGAIFLFGGAQAPLSPCLATSIPLRCPSHLVTNIGSQPFGHSHLATTIWSVWKTKWLWPNGCDQMVVTKWLWPNGCDQLVVTKWLWPNGCDQMVLTRLLWPIDCDQLGYDQMSVHRMFYIRLLVFPEILCISEKCFWKKERKKKEEEKQKKHCEALCYNGYFSRPLKNIAR